MGAVDQWANIHEDMLNEITKRLDSYSYLQFRLICKQWNFNLAQIPSGNKVPCLLLPRAKKSSQNLKIYEGTFSKLSQKQTRILEEKEIYHLTMPELQNNLIRGSCHGWIITVSIHEGTIRMINPFTKVCFDLPPISTFPNVIDIHGDKCTYDFEEYVGTLDKIYMRTVIVWKVITNSAPNNDDFMAMAIYGNSKKLAFYKPNNPRWIKFPTDHENIVDVIFFQEKIYALGDYDFVLYEFDIEENLAVIRVYEGTPPYGLDSSISQYSYLVGCDDGSLLMLVRYVLSLESTKCLPNLKTIKFEVYKLNTNSKVWSRIYNLGNYVLIVGLNSSVQISANNCKENSIYFTDNMNEVGPISFVWGHDIGIFNLEDSSCERVLSDVNLFCPPIWILP